MNSSLKLPDYEVGSILWRSAGRVVYRAHRISDGVDVALETIDAQNFEIESENKTFHKPEAKKEVKLVKANEVDKLIDLLENEAKVI
mgnify:CR=1 FL=1